MEVVWAWQMLRQRPSRGWRRGSGAWRSSGEGPHATDGGGVPAVRASMPLTEGATERGVPAVRVTMLLTEGVTECGVPAVKVRHATINNSKRPANHARGRTGSKYPVTSSPGGKWRHHYHHLNNTYVDQGYSLASHRRPRLITRDTYKLRQPKKYSLYLSTK